MNKIKQYLHDNFGYNWEVSESNPNSLHVNVIGDRLESLLKLNNIIYTVYINNKNRTVEVDINNIKSIIRNSKIDDVLSNKKSSIVRK